MRAPLTHPSAPHTRPPLGPLYCPIATIAPSRQASLNLGPSSRRKSTPYQPQWPHHCQNHHHLLNPSSAPALAATDPSFPNRRPPSSTKSSKLIVPHSYTTARPNLTAPYSHPFPVSAWFGTTSTRLVQCLWAPSPPPMVSYLTESSPKRLLLTLACPVHPCGASPIVPTSSAVQAEHR